MKRPTDLELKRTITLRQAFFEITNDINATILLSQLNYWSTRTKNDKGWIYKTIQDLQDEIFLTAYQQRRARAILRKLDLIEEKMGPARKIYFRLNFDSEEFENKDIESKDINDQQTSPTITKKLDHDNEGTSPMIVKKLDHDNEETSLYSIIEKNTSEITTESTTQISARSGRSDAAAGKSKPKVEIIFSHWREVMNHPNAKMDKNRGKLISNALKIGYSVELICQAISGCANTPHNMGDNEKGERFDGLHIILKSAYQIDRFIENFNSPPRIKTKSDKTLQNSINAASHWLDINGVNQNG